MSAGSKKPNEFKRYRQMLAAVYFATIALGSLLLGASVVRQLFFHPTVVLDGPVLSAENPDPEELLACNERVRALFEALGGETTALLAAPPSEHDRKIFTEWEAFSRSWTHEWHLVNQRCRFEELAGSGMSIAYDRMAKVHADLRAMRLKYQSLLVRFDEEQASELRRMRRALDKSSESFRALVEGARGAPTTQQAH